MSAVSDLFELFHALYTVCFCTFLLLWWGTDSKDVNQSLDEKKLGFRLSDLYNYCRNDIFNFYKYYIMEIFYLLIPTGLVAGACFMIEKYGILNE